jgi:hypothetical protein
MSENLPNLLTKNESQIQELGENQTEKKESVPAVE